MSFVIAVDLGGSHVSCLVASGDKKLRLEGVSSVPFQGLRKGMIVDEEATVAALKITVADALRQADRKGTEIVVNLSGSHVECVTGQGIKMIIPKNRQITSQDVLEVVNHSRAVLLPNDRSPIHVLPKTYKVDGQRGIKKPVGMAAGKLEVETLIATGDPAAIEALERCVRNAGFSVSQIVFTPIASGLGVLSQAEIDQGMIVVDLGATTTEVGVFVEGSMGYGASIPVGSSHISSDIAALIKTSNEEGERLKREHGTVNTAAVSDDDSVEVLQLGNTSPRLMARKVLAEIINSRAREIAALTKTAFDNSGYSRVVRSGVVLTGNGGRLDGMAELFGETFGMPVRTEYTARTTSTAAGLAKYAIQCAEDVAPGVEAASWKEKVKKLLMGG